MYFEDWLTVYGAPESIVSDRGSLFTGSFWATLMHYLHTKRRLSTAYHPQTDGQTERQNQTLEQYLRAFINWEQNDWAQWLPHAQLVYNSSKHAILGASPFEYLYGTTPGMTIRGEDDACLREAPAAKDRILQMRALRKELSERLQAAYVQQGKYYDQKHQPQSFRTGDEVMLRSTHIRTSRPKMKLDHRMLGPFKVLEPIGKQSYRLKLPPKYSRLHPVFHVSLLEPYRRRAGASTPEPVDIGGEEEFEVEQLLAKRLQKDKIEYLVRWKGSSPAEDVWMSALALENCANLIREFESSEQLRTGAETATLQPQRRKRGRPWKNEVAQKRGKR